ncbi:MAG: protein kinase [Ghiorsea sp.]|nr:protein kinase [Ghiorsea sp.]
MSDQETEGSIIFDSNSDLTSLGPYTIESRLGQGGMGIVYRATDENLGRPVAIKVLHPHLLTHENLKQRFRREARMHAKLMHPNIVTLLSLYEDDTYMALVMEVVNGDDLKVFLRKNTNLTMKHKLKIAIEILKGLEAAHEFGMVHRDLKPANVLVSKKGNIKLLDFGLAKPEEGGEDLTQSGATVGSFRYMAPEQIFNQPIDARTDLYSFGILLFYMLLGKLPFDATGSGGEFEIMEKQVREPAPKPHHIDASIPIPLSNLILQLLEKNKLDRPKNAASVRESIETMLEQLHFLSSSKNTTDKPVQKYVTTVPKTSSASLSNQQIAKQWVSYGKFRWQKLLLSILPNIKKSHTDLSIVALVFIALGFSSINILGMAEKTTLQTRTNQEKIATQSMVIAEETNAQEEPAPTPKAQSIQTPKPASIQVKSIQPKPEEKPVLQPMAKEVTAAQVVEAESIAPIAEPQPKPKVKPKPRKRMIRPITYTVQHTVKRSDKSKVNTKEKHEFRSGSHLFYPSLAEKSWLSSFKRGESTVLFDEPISLSKIIIRKASVGRLDFKHGFVRLEVKPEGKRKWRKIFERKDDDVDIAVTLKSFKKDYPSIEGVRIKFKTQEPITIGPIDLYK